MGQRYLRGVDGQLTGSPFMVNVTGRWAKQDLEATQITDRNVLLILSSEGTLINSVGDGVDSVSASIYGPAATPPRRNTGNCHG